MKISLIIPAYNEEKYIGQCLESVERSAPNQFHEIIVVDNRSTDATERIALSYKGVRVVREDKKGLTEARNKGFKEATGDLLAYIDADTKMPKNWIDTVKKRFGQDPKLVCLSGPYNYYDIPGIQKVLVKLYWLILALPISFVTGYMVVGGNFVIKKEALEKMRGFDTTIKFYGEDTNIARRASAFGRVNFDPSLVMPTSGRRFKGQGFFHTGYTYMINFVSEVVLHRPATDDYTDIR